MNPLSQLFNGVPTVIKNLVILNALMFLVRMVEPLGLSWHQMDDLLGLHHFSSPLFRPWQVITHMFMHGGFAHLAFNMLGLYMLGPRVEYRWGSKRFFLYYMLCGVGAAALYMGWQSLDARQAMAALSAEDITMLKDYVVKGAQEGMSYSFKEPDVQRVYSLFNTGMVGASGALFGVLTAFGMLYPNVELMLLFFPMPIKAKWFVLLYGAIELFSGVAEFKGDNVAHFAHLGGMVAGFLLVKIFERGRRVDELPWR